MTHISRWSVLASVIFVVGGSLGAQVEQRGPAGLAVEHLTRSRWMHGRQQPRFTVFSEAREWVSIDSIEVHGGQRGRTIFVRLGGGAVRDATASLRVAATGAWIGAAAAFTNPPEPDSTLLDATWHARSRHLNEVEQLSLLESKLWGFVPSVPGAPLRRGIRWTDTLDFSAEHDGFRQALRGVRVSVVLGDTLIDGRQLWLIGDSARLRYEERVLDDERTLNAVVIVDRAAEGTVRGRHIYDSVLGLFAVRYDTTGLAGEAVLRYPDGRSFRTSARFEATGSWTMRDSASHRRRLEALAREERSTWAVVITPVTDLERAVARDAPGVRDSVLAAWERTQDPNEYEGLQRVLYWGGEQLRRLTEAQRTARDTAYRLMLLEYDNLGRGRQLDVAELRWLLPFLEDPGLVFSFGGDRNLLYRWIVEGLERFPPASMRDSSRWPCTPDACKLLADQWYAAREPRHREVGLAALVTTDPARWADTLLARVRLRSELLGSLRQMAATVWPAVGADWHAWRPQVIHDNCLQPSNCRTVASISPESQGILRFHQARGTRDFASEITTRFRTEPSDSARLVFGLLRLAFEPDVDPDSVAARLRSPSPYLRALGAGEVEHLFNRAPPAADSATVIEILDHYMAATYSVSPGWQSLDAFIAGGVPAMGPKREELERGAYFSLDDLPLELQRKWAGRAPLISNTEWDARPEREQRSLTSVTVDGRIGPFVRVTIGTSARLERTPDQPPHEYASGSSFVLMKLGGAWVVVATFSSWIS